MAGEKDPLVSDPKSKVDEMCLIKPSTSKEAAESMQSPVKASKITKFFSKSPRTRQHRGTHGNHGNQSEAMDRQQKSESDNKESIPGSEDEKTTETTAKGPAEVQVLQQEKNTDKEEKDEEDAKPKDQSRSTKSKGKTTGKGKQPKAAKPKSASGSKRGSKAVPTQKTTLTDFYPVRRSVRKCKSDIEAEERKMLQEAVLSQNEEGLMVREFGEKGRGVVATRNFTKGEFIVEYAGDLIDLQTAKKREEEYAASPEVGCYIYYFSFNNKTYCIDATAESGRLGRLINHSRTGANCVTRKIAINDKPYLILVAKHNIKADEELLYDYGDRSKTSLDAHPWLSS